MGTSGTPGFLNQPSALTASGGIGMNHRMFYMLASAAFLIYLLTVVGILAFTLLLITGITLMYATSATFEFEQHSKSGYITGQITIPAWMVVSAINQLGR